MNSQPKYIQIDKHIETRPIIIKVTIFIYDLGGYYYETVS